MLLTWNISTSVRNTWNVSFKGVEINKLPIIRVDARKTGYTFWRNCTVEFCQGGMCSHFWTFHLNHTHMSWTKYKWFNRLGNKMFIFTPNFTSLIHFRLILVIKKIAKSRLSLNKENFSAKIATLTNKST